jgi:predicted PurR-regulated permease PerM
MSLVAGVAGAVTALVYAWSLNRPRRLLVLAATGGLCVAFTYIPALAILLSVLAAGGETVGTPTYAWYARAGVGSVAAVAAVNVIAVGACTWCGAVALAAGVAHVAICSILP